MYVAEIWRYPVKSMAGERIEEAELRVDGIPGDRAYQVRRADGRIVDARAPENAGAAPHTRCARRVTDRW